MSKQYINNNIVDNVDVVENHFKQLGIFDNILGVRVQPPIIWSFANFDVVLKAYKGSIISQDSINFYQGFGVVVEMFNAEETFPVKYYLTVKDFVSKFGQDELSYLRRRVGK